MAGVPQPLRLLLLAIALGASTASASPALHIFDRADKGTCAAKKLNACPKNLPDNFCCSEGNKCIALAGNTSALCCPVEQDCDFIQPITCNLSEQKADKDAAAPVKTTVFDVDLETCADGCCPFGYSCSDNGLCSRDKDQSKSPKDSTSTASPSGTADPTSTGSATSTEAGSASSSTSTDTPAKESDAGADSGSGSSNPETTSIIGGVVGGCLVLLLIAVIIFLYIRRNNRRHAANLEKSAHTRQNTAASGASGASGPFGNVISEPIMQPNSYRTDFILKTPSMHSNPDNAPPRPASNSRGLYPRISIPNPFASPNPSARSPTATSRGSTSSRDDVDDHLHPPRTGRVAGARLAPIRAMKASSRRLRRLTRPSSPRTPPRREPSGENINIFADPVTVGSPADIRDPRHTTFSDLMDEADLGEVRRGRPYVPGTTPRI